jgi:hypothetical protein
MIGNKSGKSYITSSFGYINEAGIMNVGYEVKLNNAPELFFKRATYHYN